jgi:hypothetical protein
MIYAQRHLLFMQKINALPAVIPHEDRGSVEHAFGLIRRPSTASALLALTAMRLLAEIMDFRKV